MSTSSPVERQNKLRFLFPESIKQRMVFNSASQLIGQLTWEAQKKGLLPSFEYVDPKHPYIDGDKFNLTCDMCSAVLQLCLRGGRLAVNKVTRQHAHDLEGRVLSIERSNFLHPEVIKRMDFLTKKEQQVKLEPEADLAVPVSVELSEQPQPPTTVKSSEKNASLGNSVALEGYSSDPQAQPQALVERAYATQFGLRSRGNIAEESMVWDAQTTSPAFQSSPIHVVRDQLNSSLNDLTAWLKNLDYEVELEAADDSFRPSCLLAVSPLMRETFARYGDLVDLDFLPITQLTSSSKDGRVCLFVVPDTNDVPLIVAIGIVPDESPTSIGWALRKFVKMQSHIQTIITPCSSSFKQAVEEYRKKHIACLHIYSVTSVCRAAQQYLRGSDEQKRRFMVVFNQAVSTKSLEVYRNNIRLLRNCADSRDMIEDMLKQSQKIFFCALPQTFVGLKRDSSKRIGQMIPTGEAPIGKLVQDLHNLAESTTIASRNSFTEYSRTVNLEFQDERLIEVRRRYERAVVERFTQNYSTALLDVQTVEQFHQEGYSSYIVENTKLRERHIIRNWKCGCLEDTRTGVPCSHVISAGLLTKVPSFTTLINPRWLKHN